MRKPSTLAITGLALAACGGSDPDLEAWRTLHLLAPPAAVDRNGEPMPEPMRVPLRWSAGTDPQATPAAPGGASPQPPQPAELRVARSDLASMLLARADLRGVEWRQESDSGALECVLAGECDAALVCRPLSQNERDAGLVAEPIGEIVFVLVVHPANRVLSVTTPQLRTLLTGQQRDWIQLGGAAGAPNLLLDDDAQFEQRAAAVLIQGDRIPSSARRLAGPDHVLATVAADPRALGLTDLASLRRRRDLSVRPLSIELQPPDQAIMPPATYPWRVPLAFVHAPGAPARVAELRAPLRAAAAAGGRVLVR